MKTRKPTKKDFETGKRFCVVHVEVGYSMLLVEVSSRDAQIEKDDLGHARINPFGPIDSIELGAYQGLSRGAHCLMGVFIDYAENEHKLVETAKEFVLQQRQAFVDQMRAEMETFNALEVQVRIPQA